MISIQSIYIALFGRPADPGGLEYWTQQTNGGTDLSSLIGRLTDSPEYRARVENLSPEEVISSIYQSLFGRQPDAEGLEFYRSLLEGGGNGIETIAIDILAGSQGTDAVVVDNRVAAANLFTENLDTPEEIAAYVGDNAAEIARELIQGITADPASIPTEQEIEDTVEHVKTGVAPTPEEPPVVTPPGGGGSNPNPEPPSSGENVDVYDQDGTLVRGFATLDEAVDSVAGAGYTIEVRNTTVSYAGDLEVDQEGLTISGNGATIRGGILITAADATIHNFTINGTLANPTTEGATVFVQANGATIDNNDLTGTAQGRTSGIIVSTGNFSGIEITGNTISDYTGYGVFTNPTTGSAAIVTGNTFEGNRYGVMFENDGAQTVSGNTFSGSVIADVGAWLTNLRGSEIDLSEIISGNIHNGGAEDVRILSSGNLVYGTSGDDFFVEDQPGDDQFAGGDGNDHAIGGAGINAYLGSNGNDTVVVTTDDAVEIIFFQAAHSGFGTDNVDTLDVTQAANGAPIGIYMLGQDFQGARDALAAGANLGGIVYAEGDINVEDDATGFFIADGGEVTTEGEVMGDVTPPGVALEGEAYLGVYIETAQGFDIYLDANGTGDLDAGDMQFQVIGSIGVDLNPFFPITI